MRDKSAPRMKGEKRRPLLTDGIARGLARIPQLIPAGDAVRDPDVVRALRYLDKLQARHAALAPLREEAQRRALEWRAANPKTKKDTQA